VTTTNPPAARAGSYRVGDLDLNRIGYGAMQLAGPGVLGPPRDRAAGVDVLRTAVELGVNHIDTADAYPRRGRRPRDGCGHHRSSVRGARRAAAGPDPAPGPEHGQPRPAGEAQRIAPVVCVQNFYNIANRADEAMLAATASQDIAYVPYFPLGGFSPVQSEMQSSVAKRLGATPTVVAQSRLLQHSPNIMLIPGTSSVDHLRENIAGAAFVLPADAVAELDAI
jgi:aryl-alcohol dehydrogenase-like predicted oxidoreductase